MFCDHAGVFLWMYFSKGTIQYEVGYYLRIVGRIALPIFLFMTAEGVRKTHNKWKYLGKIAAVWAPIALFETLASIYLGTWMAMPAQAMTEIMMYVMFACFISEKGWKKALSIIPVAYCIFSFAVDFCNQSGMSIFWGFPMFLLCDYDIYGLLMFLGFMAVYPLYVLLAKKYSQALQIDVDEYKVSVRGRKMLNNLSIIVIILDTLIFWLIAYFTDGSSFGGGYIYQYHLQSYAVISCLFIYFYNGQRGLNNKAWKWTVYLFYPVHFVVLFGIFALLFGI